MTQHKPLYFTAEVRATRAQPPAGINLGGGFPVTADPWRETLRSEMATLIHKIEYSADGALIASALWSGPLDGIIEKAKAGMVKMRANAARIVVEATAEEVWTGTNAC